jgi:uncharacterized protein (UPF0218 family)
MRNSLKAPLGQLVEGTPEYCNNVLRKQITNTKPILVILVGDTISRNAATSGISADILIVDNLEKRQKAVDYNFEGRTQFHLRNAAGTIDEDAWDTVRSAQRKGTSVIIVEGEEDLLTIVAVLEAPAGAIVAYGQPDRGIVIVNVTESEKTRARNVVEAMNRSEPT